MGSGQILVRPNELRATAERLRVSASRIKAAIQRVDEQMRLPEYVLSGFQAGEIRRRYLAKRERLNEYHVRAQYFADQLDKVADRMEEADRRLQNNKQALGNFSDFLEFLSYLSLSYKDIARNYLEIIDGFVGGRLRFKEFLKELGLQRYYKIFSKGIRYRGPSDQILKSKAFGYSLIGANVILDMFEDIENGVPEVKAFTVNFVNNVVLAHLADVNPVVLKAILINAGVQIYGDVTTGAQELLVNAITSDPQMKDVLMEGVNDYGAAFDKADITNVPKELFSTFYEVYLADTVDIGQKTKDGLWTWATEDGSFQGLSNTLYSLGEYAQQVKPTSELYVSLLHPLAPLFMDPKGTEGLGKTLQATVNVVDGVIDWNVAGYSNIAMYLTVGAENVMSDIPWVSDQNKDMVNIIANQLIRDIRSFADKVID